MHVISAQNLTKRYGSSVTALSGLTLDIEPGVVGLVGANGAGKSTLLKILLGLITPTEGTATVLGHDVTTHGSTVRELVGYMPEHDCLPPDMNATELVVHLARISGLPAAAARERAADTLRHVGLHEERYRAIGEYSTGMRQRVKLAQALAHDPALILLDEPTNGLDPAGRDEMLDLIRRIGTEFGISVLVTSHLLGELERVCDSLVVIDGGHLLRHTTIAEATTRSGVLVVEIDGEQDSVIAALEAAGCAPRTSGRRIEVESRDGAAQDVVRDAAAKAGVGIIRLELRRHSTLELFTDGAAAVPDSQREVTSSVD